ncbi:hypothetical protein S83_063950 [Arachis hypogaea]
MELQEAFSRGVTLQSCLLSEVRPLSRLVGSEDEDLHSVLAGAGFDHRRITMSDVSDRCMALPETSNKKGSKRRGDGGREDDEGEADGVTGRAVWSFSLHELVRCRKRQRKETVKGVKRCGLCRQTGHNRVSCHLNPNSRMNTQEGASYFGGEGEGETGTREDSSEEDELAWDDASDVALDEGYDSHGTIW